MALESKRNEWLRSGRRIITSTERAARAIRHAYDESQQEMGCLAWESPLVASWESWTQELWSDLSFELSALLTGKQDSQRGYIHPLHRTLLTAEQELRVWSSIIQREQIFSDISAGLNLAAMARRTLAQLVEFAPQFLNAENRLGWSGDARTYSDWLGQFLRQCERSGWISSSLLSLTLLHLLEDESVAGWMDGASRPSLLLVGFDRLSAPRRSLLDRLCSWKLETSAPPPHSTRYVFFEQPSDELSACVVWIQKATATNPAGRWLIVTSQIERDRGEIERALHQLQQAGHKELDAEFTLGVPLDNLSMIRVAMLLLRWQSDPLQETELRSLLTADALEQPPQHNALLSRCLEQLQSSDLARTEWSFASFCQHAQQQQPALVQWCKQMLAAQSALFSNGASCSAALWMERIRAFLDAAGWMHDIRLESFSYQAKKQWEELLDACAGTASVSDEPLTWTDALSLLSGLLKSRLFSVERALPQVQITGPAESAGLIADGVWVLGADSSQWPSSGHIQPLLPLSVQLEAEMPHASLQIDWNNAATIAHRLLDHSDEVVFSFSKSVDDGMRRASGVLSAILGQAQAYPDSITNNPADAPPSLSAMESVCDPVFVPLQGNASATNSASSAMAVRGGASVLMDQSACPFRAFAHHRIGVSTVQPASPGISPRVRGKLLHEALRTLWGGTAQQGLRTLEDLLRCIEALGDDGLEAIVQRHVLRAVTKFQGALQSETIPTSLVRMEQERLQELICNWLRYEASRRPFSVQATEQASEIEIAGIRLRVRQDRIDQVGERLLILDYKTSKHSAALWLGDRPDDLQLPLYALHMDEATLEGIAFANINANARDLGVNGMLVSARETLNANLSGASTLVKQPLDSHQLVQWRMTMEKLARDFLQGVAWVDPKNIPKTCEYCGLESFCRVTETGAILSEEENANE